MCGVLKTPIAQDLETPKSCPKFLKPYAGKKKKKNLAPHRHRWRHHAPACFYNSAILHKTSELRNERRKNATLLLLLCSSCYLSPLSRFCRARKTLLVCLIGAQRARNKGSLSRLRLLSLNIHVKFVYCTC
jgi:hypothetical protein